MLYYGYSSIVFNIHRSVERMHKAGFNHELVQSAISLRAELCSGDFRVLGSPAKVSISCVSEVSPGLCINLCGKVQPCGQAISVRATAKSRYRVITSQAIGFTAVVYGCIIRICRRVKFRVDKFCRATADLTVRPRMAQLSFAGGLRL